MAKRLIIYLMFAILIFSCGKQEAEEPDDITGNDNPYNWNEPLKPASKLTEEELPIATRICKNFEKKRAYLATQSRGLVLDYKVSELKCGQSNPQVERARGRMTMNRDGAISMTGLTPGQPVFDDVLTDQHSRVKPFCDQLLAGANPSNTTTNGPFRHQVSFFRQIERDWIQIVEFQSSNGSFYPFIIERASVVTELDNDTEAQHGFVSLRAINRPCSDGSSQFIMQEWL